MTADDVRRVGAELGLDALGVTRAEAYEETERHIVERRERGLFAGMKFTMARPEQSCHPEHLLAGARSVVSAALGYWEPEEPLRPGQGRLARYTWADSATGCSSTRTSTSTARRPPAAGSASTARTRC